MAFLAYFLCLTKSMETFPAGNAFGGYAALKGRGAAKEFNFVSEKLLFVCADSRFAEPRISFWKGFNFVCANLLF